MIYIDYYNGSHGQFLQFVCNKIAGVKTRNIIPGATAPFTVYNNILDGAAHWSVYRTEQKFHGQHFTHGKPDKPIPPNSKVICIELKADDALQAEQIALARGSNFRFDSDLLENDTFTKLNNIQFNWMFEHIKDITGHVITAENPNCPRNILRSYFEHRIFNKQWIKTREFNNYSADKDVYKIPYQHFYNETLFIEHIKKIATWANLQYNNYDAIKELHVEFMKRQPYANSREQCNQVIDDIVNNVNNGPDKMYLLEEAYVNHKLEELGHERRY